jgi:RNA polymerase sigma-70 factor (ECF subfamily)
VHRLVITLRDLEECSATEVCQLLDLTPANQRVVLHRARAKVRAALEEHLAAVIP